MIDVVIISSHLPVGSVPELSYLVPSFTTSTPTDIDEKDSHDSDIHIHTTKKFTSSRVRKVEQIVQLERRMAQGFAMTKHLPDVQQLMEAV